MSIPLQRQLRFWLIGIVLFFLGVYVFRSVLLPFVAGMAMAYLLDPVCDRLERLGLSRTVATALVTLVFLTLVVIGLLLLIPVLVGQLLLLIPVLVGQIAGLIQNLPDYVEGLRTQLATLVQMIEARLDAEILTDVKQAIAGSAKQIVVWATKMLGQVVSGGVAIANLLSLLFITPIVAFYLLRDWDRLVDLIDSWLPRSMVETVRQEVSKVDQTLSGFVRGQATVCVLLGAFYAIGLTLSGLQFGLVVGLTAGLLSFIPFVGTMVGFVASFGLALVQFDDWMRIGIVVAIFVVGQVVEGNVLTPKLVGDRVGLHPVWVIFALLAGGALFGFVGILLAVPVAAVLGVLIRYLLSRYLESGYFLGAGGEADSEGNSDG
jgi:predicted PurR-regulated permease PerM